MADKVRAHAIITGIVQGVFFRMEGWVRNKRDGAVEAVFEGDSQDVEAVIDWRRQGPERAIVHDVVVEWEDYTGDCGGFHITY